VVVQLCVALCAIISVVNPVVILVCVTSFCGGRMDGHGALVLPAVKGNTPGA
jgi:hypothetical protein